MKISDILKALALIQNEYGDLFCCMRYSGSDFTDVASVGLLFDEVIKENVCAFLNTEDTRSAIQNTPRQEEIPCNNPACKECYPSEKPPTSH